ncbi:hypothetical protein EVB87_211 [Rhizobium phage RHph_N28_1]|nr:hypothetical protein EVB87_211 [Rhizobium phage RHph_N28_1]QIG74240.1 hypothetical protein EVC07_212 [Rhizobium phage RHph_N42]QIG74850.1 hypothetical protein EVC12_215 [Rhizobium phage RHph_I42]QXV73900.1 hypothetical protein [Rhizobium phage RHph_N46]
MGIIVSSEEFRAALKIGLAKVKDPITSVAIRKGKLTLSFTGASVNYQKTIECGEGKLEPTAFDASLLSKLATPFSGELDLSVDGPDLKLFKKGRSKVTVPCAPFATGYSDDGDAENVEAVEDDPTLFKGWIEKHPLHHIYSLKSALKAIKDNITKTELVVEAEWGVNKLLRLKITDQFHGLLIIANLPEIPHKKKVRIRLPLSSFLLLTDITGDLFVDAGQAIIKDESQVLTCRFLAGAAFGSIDDMQTLVSQAKSETQVDAKELHNVVSRIAAIAEQDDMVNVSSNGKKLTVGAEMTKAAVKDFLPSKGELGAFALPPKNFQDVTTCLSGMVSISDLGNSVIFKARKGEVVIYGAVVKVET